eukprot:4849665-Prymnesium_polylepis.1
MMRADPAGAMSRVLVLGLPQLGGAPPTCTTRHRRRRVPKEFSAAGGSCASSSTRCAHLRHERLQLPPQPRHRALLRAAHLRVRLQPRGQLRVPPLDPQQLRRHSVQLQLRVLARRAACALRPPAQRG